MGSFNVRTGVGTTTKDFAAFLPHFRPGLKVHHAAAEHGYVVSGQVSTECAYLVLGWSAVVKLREGLRRPMKQVVLTIRFQRVA